MDYIVFFLILNAKFWLLGNNWNFVAESQKNKLKWAIFLVLLGLPPSFPPFSSNHFWLFSFSESPSPAHHMKQAMAIHGAWDVCGLYKCMPHGTEVQMSRNKLGMSWSVSVILEIII